MGCFATIRSYLRELREIWRGEERVRYMGPMTAEEAHKYIWQTQFMLDICAEPDSFKLIDRLSRIQRRALDYEQYERRVAYHQKAQEKDKKKQHKGGVMLGNNILDVYRDMKAAEIARRESHLSAFNDADIASMYKMAAYYNDTKIKESLEVADSSDYGDDAGFGMFYNHAEVENLETANVADAEDDGEDVGFGMFYR